MTTNGSSQERRRPYLAIVSMSSEITDTAAIFKKMQETYNKDEEKPNFDELVGLVSSFNQWSIFKGKPNSDKSEASYTSFTHNNNGGHLGLQFLLTGIFSVFYDESRRNIGRPGFTAFPNDAFVSNLGMIECKGSYKKSRGKSTITKE